MRKVVVEPLGWEYVVIALDWYTKKIIGRYDGLQAKSTHWLLAIKQAVQRQLPAGVLGQGLSLMSDNGCQPTSVTLMKTCATLGITQAFTSDNNAKGNADMERLMRTLKEELLWAPRVDECAGIGTHPGNVGRLGQHEALDSALGYRTPC